MSFRVSRLCRSAAAFICVLLGAACSHDAGPSSSKASAASASASATPNVQPPSFLRYPGTAGAIEPWIQQQVELADAAHLQVLVYVGASWCEPCQRFHQAVERGELNGALNGLRFLEFDQDRDASALKVAGYVYQYIPVLALPDPDGRNHGRMITGSIKGPNAVQQDLVPRLQALLAGKVVD
ncbi:MAG TPA: thioredoxin family protein [Polyangiaceae bacterium]|nr:thioredoxin family protein [Polyangiaceae bacterium]